MKVLAALLLSTVCCTALPAHRIEQASHASSQNKHRKDTQQAPASPSASVSSAVNQPSPQVKQASTKSKSKYWRRGFIPPTWSGWAVFVVAFGGICVAIRSLKVLTRQTEATEKAAKAAMESVEFIVSKERARLMVEKPLPLIPAPAGKTQYVEFKVLFSGTTPAFILEYGCDPRLSDSPQPSTEEDHLILPLMDLPSVITPQTLLTTQPAFLLPNAKLSQEDIDAINNGKKFIHFQGYIKYRDVFDRRGICDFAIRGECPLFKVNWVGGIKAAPQRPIGKHSNRRQKAALSRSQRNRLNGTEMSRR